MVDCSELSFAVEQPADNARYEGNDPPAALDTTLPCFELEHATVGFLGFFQNAVELFGVFLVPIV